MAVWFFWIWFLQGGYGGDVMARRFNNLNDVKKYLSHVLNGLEDGSIEKDDARVRGYVSSVLHKVLLDNDLESRVKVLEEKLAIQGGKSK